MTTRQTIELDMVILLAVSAAAGIVFATFFNQKSNASSFSFSAVGALQNETPINILTPVPKIETSSQISPDGTKTLTMAVTTNKDQSKTYAFTPSIYPTTTLSSPNSMSIPFNAWSPDNVYVFVEQKDASGSGALVMKADGQPFVGGEKYFDARALFIAKNTGNTYQETTGWASETLLIVNTTKPNGTKGPSYWFELPSRAIIQLSSEF